MPTNPHTGKPLTIFDIIQTRDRVSPAQGVQQNLARYFECSQASISAILKQHTTRVPRKRLSRNLKSKPKPKTAAELDAAWDRLPGEMLESL